MKEEKKRRFFHESPDSPRSLMDRIPTSNWFAFTVLIVAAISLGLLYDRGRVLEAGMGAGLLAVATILIFRGIRSR